MRAHNTNTWYCYSSFDYIGSPVKEDLKICWDGCACGVSQIDQILTVSLGLLGGVLGIPDGLHLGDIGTVLIFSGLVGSKSLSSPPDASNKSCVSAGLDEGGNTEWLC